MAVNILNQKNYTEIDKVDDTNFIDEETEFLLEEYNQMSSVDELEEISDEKVQYEGTKVIFGYIYFIILNINFIFNFLDIFL